MTAKQNSKSEVASETTLSEEQVRNFLREHVDFFERHPDILDHIQVSHSSGEAVSLVEKQVSVLRERNMEMRRRLNSLTSNARDNDRLYELTRKTVLSLMEAEDLDDLSSRFLSSMRGDFEVEYASFILFSDTSATAGSYRVESADSARREIGALIKSRTPVCGTLRGEELRYLFPEAGHVGSAAVVPIFKGGELGVIAVGSQDPLRYSAGMGTVFLSHIADVMARLLPRLTQCPPEGR